MRKILVASLLLSSLPLMAAEEINYKSCSSTFNAFEVITNNFAKMDAKGDFKIKSTPTTMATLNNTLVYRSNNLIKDKNLLSKKEKLVDIDKETLEIEYESIVDGKPVGKIKRISYTMENLKDLDNKRPGAVDISFDYKNGQCIPQVTKYDNSAGLSPGLKLMFKGINKMGSYGDSGGARDLYKCKELHDYMKDIKDLEACRDSKTKLARLEQLANNVDAKSGKKAEEVNSKKAKESINDYYEVIHKAYASALTCNDNGYREVLVDDEFWKKINAESVVEDDTKKVQVK